MSRLAGLAEGSLDQPRLPAPTLQGKRAVLVDRKQMSTSPLMIAVKGVSDSDPDLLPLEVGNFIFGADFTSRLMQVLRAENGWTYGAYSGFNQLFSPQAEAGVFSLYTFPSVEFASLAIQKALAMLEEYVQAGLSEDDFHEAIEALSNRYAFEVDTVEKRLNLKLREILTGHLYDSPESYRGKLGALTREQVNSVILRRTLLSDWAVSVVGDAETLLPVLNSLPGIESVEVLDIQP